MNDTFKLLPICLLLVFCKTTYAGELRPFTSDGCSSFPNGTLQQKSLWLQCCVEHDKAYWKGGTYRDRINADQALRQCVAAVGEPEVAQLMLAGVRVGGSPYFPTTFRWGYGWPYPKGYGALTDEERKQVDALSGKVTYHSAN